MSILPQRFNSTSAPIFSGPALIDPRIPELIAQRDQYIERLNSVYAVAVTPLRDEVDRLERHLYAVLAIVQRYRLVSPSADAVCYVRDIEIALGMDLPPVRDRDGRTDW